MFSTGIPTGPRTADTRALMHCKAKCLTRSALSMATRDAWSQGDISLQSDARTYGAVMLVVCTWICAGTEPRTGRHPYQILHRFCQAQSQCCVYGSTTITAAGQWHDTSQCWDEMSSTSNLCWHGSNWTSVLSWHSRGILEQFEPGMVKTASKQFFL